jgi:Tol biopolymer transport system component
VPNQTPTSNPTATPTKAVIKSTPSTLSKVCSEGLTLCLQAPDGWETMQNNDKMAFSTTKTGLDDKNITDAAVRIGRSAKVTTESDLLANLLANFPTDAKSLNAAPLGIAGQKWTSTQIQYTDSKTNQEGIATLAVTIKEDKAYYLVAVAPAEEWNVLRDTYQAMISGLRFVTPEQAAESKTPTVSKATAESESTETASTVVATKTVTSKVTEEATTVKTTATAKSTATPKSTPTDSATATPTSSPTPKSTPTPTATPAPLTYIVVAGDSLGRIAGKFGVDVDLLASENGLDKEKSTLQVGDKLIIPFTQEELDAYNKSNGTPVASKATDETTPKATKTTAEGTATVTDTAKATPQATTTKTETATVTAPATLSGRIVYPVFNSGPGSYDIWLADLATNEQVIIANQASQPAFSRNGSLLAYRSWDIRSRGIIYRDFVGGAGGQVTSFVEDALPAWSPDGFTFIFSSRREGDRTARLFKGDYTRKDSEKGLGFEGNYLDVFPDGRIVAKGCLAGGQACGLYVMSAIGSNPVKIDNNEDADTAPAASPDGQRIALMSSGRGGSNWEVWTINADGSDPKRLTDNSNNDGIPTWSPDGKSIAFASDRGGSWAIWVMNADGTNQTKLFDMKGSPNGKVLVDQNNSFGWWEERISWAP